MIFNGKRNIFLLILLLNSSLLFAVEDDRFKVQHLKINSRHSDFGPIFYNEQVVFASTRRNTTVINRIWKINELPYLNLYVADVANDNGELSNLNYFKHSFNDKFNEGPASFAENGSIIAYTRNNNNRKGLIRLSIVMKEFVNGAWQDAVFLPFNNDSYSVGHPSFEKDGNVMYFVSDMPGGYGGTDIYKVEKGSDNSWGDPVNLGPEINTDGNEMFPFHHKDGMLFYASNGRGGYGGLDVFVADLGVDNSIGEVRNLGPEINSAKDDFSLILSEDQSFGYFSSDREGGKGSDDMYYFTNTKPFAFNEAVKEVENPDNLSLSGYVLDPVSGEPVQNAEIKYTDLSTGEYSILKTDENGKFLKELDNNKLNDTVKYAIEINNANGESSKQNLETVLNNTELNLVNNGEPVSLMGNTDPISQTFDADSSADNNNQTVDNDIPLSGYVLDPVSGKPLQNTEIKYTDLVTGEHYILETDENGKFSKPLEHYELNDTVRYAIEINNANGESSKQNFETVLNDTELNLVNDGKPVNIVGNNIDSVSMPDVTQSTQSSADKSEKVMISGTILPSDGVHNQGSVIAKLYDSKGNFIESVDLDNKGNYSFSVEPHDNYQILIEKDGIDINRNDIHVSNTNIEKSVQYDNVSQNVSTDDTFTINKDEVKNSSSVNTSIQIAPIYFDFDSYKLRPDALVELNKLVTILNENPTMKVELSSHTDSRGASSYNMSLSQKRLESSLKYIKKRISNPERATGSAHGEESLVNNCSDDDLCSSKQHQANRRTEFILK